MMMTHPNNKADHIDVAVIAHPFSSARELRKVESGATIADIVQEAQPDDVLAQHAHVYVGDEYVARENWPRVRPKAGASVTVRMVPMGGGGSKNPLRTLLSIAVVAATPYLAAGLGSVFGGLSIMGVGASRLITAGVGLLSKLALNAIAPPPRARVSGSRDSQAMFIQGARNQVVPFGRVPCVLGRHRFVPPLGALPYTETVGGDQYIRMLFVWGYGPLEISDLKIGETPLSDFDGVQVETRSGYQDDPAITLYSNSVLQTDLQVSLSQASGWMTRTTETEADEISVDITLPNGLVAFDDKGNKKSRKVELEVQYSPAGQNEWSAGASGFKTIPVQYVTGISVPAALRYSNKTYQARRIDRVVIDPVSGVAKVIEGTRFYVGRSEGSPQPPPVPEGMVSLARVERRSGDPLVIPSNRITDERGAVVVSGGVFQNSTDFSVTASGDNRVLIGTGGIKYLAFDISGKKTVAIRQTVRFRVPRGQYDVRVRRLTADSVSTSIFDATVWTALRTVRYTRPVAMKGVAMTALRIKASDQLNGVIERFNGVVHSILPDWDGEAWVEQPTSNPASIFRHVLQGRANARPLADSRIDLAKIEEWHDNCAARDCEFNAVIDYDASVRDVLQEVAAVGRASPTLVDGKWAVVEDKPQVVPVQHFTPRNTFGFKGEKAFDDIPHALRVRFVNRAKGWLQDERIVFDDGYTAENATHYETLELHGVTDADQAWKDGRYHLATARLRPETYSFYTDIEHIVCTRGDMIKFTHDVPLIGLMSGRVNVVTVDNGFVTAVKLDAGVPMWDGRSYAVRFRRKDGSSVVSGVVTVAGTHLDLVLLSPIPVDVGPEIGDLALFGESGQESASLIVKSIEPDKDLRARITCVDADENVHMAPNAPMPVFNSVLTGVGVQERPPAPVVAQIQSGLESMIRHADGSLTSRLVITLEPPSFSRRVTVEAMIRATGESNFRQAAILAEGGNSVSITDIEEGETYDVRLRYITYDGVSSSPIIISAHRVEGASAVPSDVTNLNMHVLHGTAHLSWDAVRDIDLAYYTLRYSPQVTGIGWGNATEMIVQIPKGATSVSVPAAVGTYLLKAVDIRGHQSASPALVVSTIAGLEGYNAVLTVTESAPFAGERLHVGISGSTLRLIGSDTIDEWSEFDPVINVDIGESGLALKGIYYFAQSADLGAVYTSRLKANMDVSGLDLNASVDDWQNIDDAEDWDQEADPSFWNVQLEVRVTSDDPVNELSWSAWMPFIVGNYSARAFQFRAILRSDAPMVTPVVTSLSVEIDMPDRTDGARDVLSDPAGTVVVFSTAFKETPVITVTAQNMATGDYYEITDTSADGFNIRFFDAAGSGIARRFDYLAQGYGHKIL